MSELTAVSEAEEWRPVHGGFYLVSNLGRVMRAKKYRKPVGLIRPWVTRHGYQRICLRVSGKKILTHVHQIVCEAFIGPQPDGYTVNHKDGNKMNNRITNLEYLTVGDNIRHAAKNGLTAWCDKCGEPMRRRDILGAKVWDCYRCDFVKPFAPRLPAVQAEPAKAEATETKKEGHK